MSEDAHEQALQELRGTVAERERDFSGMTVELMGLAVKGKLLPQYRVMLDNHRAARRLQTAAQVGWIYEDGRIAWLQGYSWAFDVGNQRYTEGSLTGEELEKIEQLAQGELPKWIAEREKRERGERQTETADTGGNQGDEPRQATISFDQHRDDTG